MFDNEFTGHHAVVCGSTRGIGRATAEMLAANGATITLVARSKAALEEVSASLSTEKGQKHSLLEADFNNPTALEDTIATHAHVFSNVSILVNNSGGPPAGLAIHAEPDDFQVAFQRHLLASQRMVQAVLPGMKEAGYGRIINIISTSVKSPIPGLGVSNTIRGAVASWSKTLAGELGPYGVTVNNVLPGATATDRLMEIIESKAGKAGITIEDVKKSMKAEIPVRRFAQPQEIAAAIAFLASGAASYINGINLPVDGGRLACL